MLGYPNVTRKFNLYTDASMIELVYIMTQDDEKGHEKVIFFGSKKLTPTEMRYAITEKECLAVVRGFYQHRQYLLSNVTTVYTDHAPLVRNLDGKRPTSQMPRRLLRLALGISEYDY